MAKCRVGRSESLTFFRTQNLSNSSRSLAEPHGSLPSFFRQRSADPILPKTKDLQALFYHQRSYFLLTTIGGLS